MVKDPPAMSETWVQSLGWEGRLEKGMATHSSVLAWRIQWTSDTLLKALLLALCRMKSFHSGWQEKEGALPKPGGASGVVPPTPFRRFFGLSSFLMYLLFRAQAGNLWISELFLSPLQVSALLILAALVSLFSAVSSAQLKVAQSCPALCNPME